MLTTGYHLKFSIPCKAILCCLGQKGSVVCAQDSDREDDKELLLRSFKNGLRINEPKKQKGISKSQNCL